MTTQFYTCFIRLKAARLSCHFNMPVRSFFEMAMKENACPSDLSSFFFNDLSCGKYSYDVIWGDLNCPLFSERSKNIIVKSFENIRFAYCGKINGVCYYMMIPEGIFRCLDISAYRYKLDAAIADIPADFHTSGRYIIDCTKIPYGISNYFLVDEDMGRSLFSRELVKVIVGSTFSGISFCSANIQAICTDDFEFKCIDKPRYYKLSVGR